MSKRSVAQKSIRVDSESDFEDDSDKDPSFDPSADGSAMSKKMRIQERLENQPGQSSESDKATLQPGSKSDKATLQPGSKSDKATLQPGSKSDKDHPTSSIPSTSQSTSATLAKSKFSSYFDIQGENEERTAQCLLCRGHKKFKMTGRSTTTLKRHLKNVHFKAFKKIFPHEAMEDKKDQVTIEEAFAASRGSNTLKDKLKTEEFNKATVDWITKKYLPFSFFEDQATQDYFKLVNPNLSFPKRFTLKRMVQDQYLQYKETLKKHFAKCSSKISFTIDGWTSLAGKSYYGITAHFIDEEWFYRSIVLDFVPSKGKHTGEDIAVIFSESLKEFGLEKKVQGITVDNASANTSFMMHLESKIENFDAVDQHFRCMSHILNLGVQDMMRELQLQQTDETMEEDEIVSDDEEECREVQDTSTALNKLRSVVSKVRRSEVLKNKFKSACETAGAPSDINPILDCPTGWNSTHDMLGVALKLKLGLNTLCLTVSELNLFQLSENEWEMFEKIHKFLMNFKTLSRNLCTETVTLPSVIVSFNLLVDNIEHNIKKLDSKIEKSTVDIHLIKGFQAARDKILKHYRKTNWVYCIVLILDPRHKIETFDLTEWGKEIKEESMSRFQRAYSVYEEKLKKTTVSSSSSQESLNDEDNVLDFNQLYSTKSTFTEHKDELENYLNMKRSSGSEDILQWWRRNQASYPILAAMARDFFSIPATSVPSERLFSKAALVMRKHRVRLNDESARWLLCINSWSEYKPL